jgi:hypothetical protein
VNSRTSTASQLESCIFWIRRQRRSEEEQFGGKEKERQPHERSGTKGRKNEKRKEEKGERKKESLAKEKDALRTSKKV